MKLSKLFKYGFLAIGLLGNTIAMEDDKKTIVMDGSKIERQLFLSLLLPNLPSELNIAIVQSIPYRNLPALRYTCQSWNKFVEDYCSSPLAKMYKEINITIHPDLRCDMINFGCTSDLFCIFLPFQESTPTVEVKSWEKTGGFCINGYTGQVQSLTPFDGKISSCYPVLYSHGIISRDENQNQSSLQLLTITDTFLNTQSFFGNIEEVNNSLAWLCCSASHMMLPSIVNTNPQEISCYPVNGGIKRTVTLPDNNYQFFNFGEKFLVRYNNSLQVIDPSLEALEASIINLPSELIVEGASLARLVADEDSVILSVLQGSLSERFILLNNILSEQQPTAFPLNFAPKGYNVHELYLKNSYIFSVVSLANTENAMDGTINQKHGGFLVYDLLSHKQCFKYFFPGIPYQTSFAGNMIFIQATTNPENYHCQKYDNGPSSYCITQDSLLSFNIEHFLI